MKISDRINVNIVKTVENAVGEREDFHFYVDELTSSNHMPTYAGMADEKYAFEDMDDEFFEFINRKISEDGIYIRLILAEADETSHGVVFTLECGSVENTFITSDVSDLLVFDFADYGIKIHNGEVTLGTTISGGCGHTPYFAELGSDEGNKEYLSLDNPLNQFIVKLMWDMIVVDE